MEKINFQQPKNQFQRAEIGFLLKGWLLQIFRIFNGALNQTILFLLDRKFVSTSWNEEFVKKTVSLGRNCFHCLEYLINGKNGFFQREKQFLLGAMKFFCKNYLPHNFRNGYHQQKEYYNTKEYYFTQTEKKENNSSGLKNVFPLAGVKNFLKIISGNGRKWFPLARK